MRSQVSGFHATVEEAEKAPPCLQKKKKKKKQTINVGTTLTISITNY
jgi:hypothetical protein